MGWLVAFRGERALELTSVEIKGRAVGIAVEGYFDFRRSSSSNSKDWPSAPMKACNGVIRVLDIGTADTLARHHVDLANEGQAGPAWHLQLGGLAADREAKSSLEWLDVPRWGVPPVDLMLLAEIALYNFHPDQWAELSEEGVWVDWIHRSETLVLTHWFDRLASYWDQRVGRRSWLYEQQRGVWNPCPA